MRELGIPRLVAALMAQRGIGDPEAADRFLNPRLEDLNDPKLLPDFEPAVRAILGARERGELIFVHGDYDVDGVTSAAILSRFLRNIGANVYAHVPHRAREGYGIHEDTVAVAHAKGAKLFLTCDCGIGAHTQVAAARGLGMEVVVTDHHSVGETIPEAAAVVNPHRKDSNYPFRELSGAGVVFKLCEGIARELGLPLEKYYKHFIELAAIGTIADVMPLEGENRVIAKFGLENLGETQKAGLRALMEIAGIGQNGKPVRAYNIGFGIGPRLNAVGRIDDSATALRLLLEKDLDTARAIAMEIENANEQRKQTQTETVQEAIDDVLATGQSERNVIVVARPNWHPGVVGIAAGKVMEQFRRPAFVAVVDAASGMCKASGRSIPQFNLASAIRAFPNLVTGGGHAMAAGMGFHVDDLDRIRESFHEFAGQFLTEEDFLPTAEADLELDPADTNLMTIDTLEKLEPFGNANPEPQFLVRGAMVSSLSPCRDPKHVKGFFRLGDSSPIETVAWNMGDRFASVSPGDHLDLIVNLQVNEWNGRRTAQWRIKDIVG